MSELPPSEPALPAGFPRTPYRRPQRPGKATVSSLLGGTMRIWTSTLPKLLAVAVLVDLPRFALAWYFRSRPVSPAFAQVADAFDNLEMLLVPEVIGAFAVYFVFQRLRGEPADLGRSIALGFRRIGAALGIFFLFALPQIASVFVPRPVEGTTDPYQLLRAGSGSLGIGLLISVSNLVFALVFATALPAAIVERIGVFPALARSARLTSGRRGTIFFANIIFFFVIMLVVLPIEAISGFPGGSLAEFLLTSVITWVGTSLSSVFPIVLYHELRRTKEGFGAEELAKAFD